MKVKFKKGNKLPYDQDFGFHKGIPSGVLFEITFLDEEKTEAILTGPGYGDKPYGNGAIYISKKLFETAKKKAKK